MTKCDTRTNVLKSERLLKKTSDKSDIKKSFNVFMSNMQYTTNVNNTIFG